MSRARKPSRIWLILIAISLVAIIAVVFAIEPWAVSDGQILAKADATMDSVKSYQFQSQSQILDLRIGSTVSIHSEGAFVFPNSIQQRDTRDTSVGDGWHTRDIIVIGENSYLRYDDNDWSTGTAPEDIFPITQSSIDFEIFEDIQRLPDELIRGVICIHFIETLDLSKQSSPFPEGVEVTIEIWISEEDSLPRRVKFSQEFLKDPKEIFGTGTVVLVSAVTEFYDYDYPISIMPPDA